MRLMKGNLKREILPPYNKVETTFNGDYVEMKKIRVQWSVKRVMLTVFWDVKGKVTINFLGKGATVSSSSNCQFLRQNSSYLLNDPQVN